MSRLVLGSTLVAVLASSAAAGELIELRDGTLHEAEIVVVDGQQLILQLVRGNDIVVKQLRVRLKDVEPLSAARAWAGTLSQDAAGEWLRLAEFSRANGLFDVAELGYEHAAAADPEKKPELSSFRAARPAEESRHLLYVACDRLRAGRHAAAATAARGAIEADADGPYAEMAGEVIDVVSTAASETPVASRAQLQRIERLERFVARATARLDSVQRRPYGQREATLASATRLLGGVAAQLQRILDQGTTPVTTRAQRSLDDALTRRAGGMVQLADLRLDRGARSLALTTVHDILAFSPELPAALDLRSRLLDRIEDDQRFERNMLASGARRLHHPYPYPARDVRSGIGLVPTWDPVRGLGRLPYSRSRSARTAGAGPVVVPVRGPARVPGAAPARLVGR